MSPEHTRSVLHKQTSEMEVGVAHHYAADVTLYRSGGEEEICDHEVSDEERAKIGF